MSSAPTYTTEQLDQYFTRIQYARSRDAPDRLQFLNHLIRQHRAHVPFECLDLHYTKARLLSLDPEDLFHKVVVRRRGGYCMEVNSFFAAVLRSLGFALFSAGARVKGRHSFGGWNHMVNIVTVSNVRYLVDVGFGSNGPPHAIPLDEASSRQLGVAPSHVRLAWTRIGQHTDPAQRLWVYLYEEGDDHDGGRGWIQAYAFSELEFFPDDFDVMNLSTMTSPRSMFVQSVVVQQTILDDAGDETVGELILHKDYVKRKLGSRAETLKMLGSEGDRRRALERYFGICLTDGEAKAIRGLASELKG